MKDKKQFKVTKKTMASRIEDLVEEVDQAREAINTLKEEKEELIRLLAKAGYQHGGGKVAMVVKFRLTVPSDFDEENVKNAVETVIDEVVRDGAAGDQDAWDMLADMTDVTVTREGE